MFVSVARSDGLQMKTVFTIFISTMYVCVCLAVTQAEVQAVIEEGATTREVVTRVCRAGGDCGRLGDR